MSSFDKLSMSLDDLVARNARSKPKSSRELNGRGGVNKVERRQGATRIGSGPRPSQREEHARRRSPVRRDARPPRRESTRCAEGTCYLRHAVLTSAAEVSVKKC